MNGRTMNDRKLLLVELSEIGLRVEQRAAVLALFDQYSADRKQAAEKTGMIKALTLIANHGVECYIDGDGIFNWDADDYSAGVEVESLINYLHGQEAASD